jgi:hypothetical protein
MLRADLSALLRSRAQTATAVDVVGPRLVTQRRVFIGAGMAVLMTLSMVQTAQMGRLMSSDPFVSSVPLPVHEVAPYTYVDPPSDSYRVTITDLGNARTVTTVNMDPKQWSDLEQRAFLRKLLTQADQRAIEGNQVFEVHAYAVQGDAQMQAQRFLRQALQDAGIATQAPNWSQDGQPANGRVAGLRFAFDDSAQSLDHQGSDSCLVTTGDEVACIRKEAQAQTAEASPRRRRRP